jgi:hypothetical protein
MAIIGKLEEGKHVIINSEAVVDSELSDNKGTIKKLWLEPLPNSEPTPLVLIQLDNGETGVVGQHEIKLG